MTCPDLPILAGMVPAAVFGGLVGGIAGFVPALHVFNVLAAAAVLAPFGLAPSALPVEWLDATVAGMIAGWAITNTLPAILLAAPDESALFTVLPGQRLLMEGRGYEAVLTTAAGAAGGMVLLIGAAFVLPRLLPPVHAVLSPHYHWIIWCVIAFMLLSEWPQGRTAAMPTLERLLSANRNGLMGSLTFLLSGLLGFVLLYRPNLVHAAPGQVLTPAFAGLFAMPWLIMNLFSRAKPPPQDLRMRLCATPGDLLHGIASGTLGGAFAAFIPVVSGGIGGMLAGHATSLGRERAFLAAQGASKTVYYAGAFMLAFVPGLHLARGGGIAFLRTLHEPAASAYVPVIAALLIATITALLMLPVGARLLLRALERMGQATLSWIALAVVGLIVLAVSGGAGLLIMLVAAGIGLIPPLFGARRMNGLGVILLPLACNMSGIGPAVAAWLGIT